VTAVLAEQRLNTLAYLGHKYLIIQCFLIIFNDIAKNVLNDNITGAAISRLERGQRT
jgi:hypothetical protein